MSPSLAALRREAADCRRCDLWKLGTQTVFGEGRRRGLMLVGEQPGDVEDREGRPFVGPAGTLLRELLDEVGVDDREVYVTNAVKHFKWRPKGKRRIHDKPSWGEVQACGHWLANELAAVDPALVVASARRPRRRSSAGARASGSCAAGSWSSKRASPRR